MVRARVGVRVCTIHTPLSATTSLACLAKESLAYLRRWLYNLLAVHTGRAPYLHTLQAALLTTYLLCARYRPRCRRSSRDESRATQQRCAPARRSARALRR